MVSLSVYGVVERQPGVLLPQSKRLLWLQLGYGEQIEGTGV